MTYASATSVGRRAYQRNQNSVVFSATHSRLGPISNFVVLLVLACLLAVVYLSQVTKTNSYSYSLDTLNDEKVAMQKEVESLEVEAARLKSLEHIKRSQVAQSLVDPESVTYVN